MNSARRMFLKKLAGGSAGIMFGTYSFNSPMMKKPSGSFTGERSVYSEFGIFPFYRFLPNYNIGDYIPKDQGGKFVQMELLKTEDDHQIVEKIRTGLLEKVYGNPVSWNRFESGEVEKSVWLNRFYFLPSFARMYYLSGDMTYLNDMTRIIARWIEDNPLLPESHLKTYNWRDMQVAWRSIHWSWCYFLTEKALTDEQKSQILNSLKQHADILLSGFGKAPLNDFNHQSHGALAMLYLGVLFPTFKQADDLKLTAVKIFTHHLEKAFYNDGGNVEQMFGYYPFEAHIFRDAYLLLSKNNLKIPEIMMPQLRKMADFIKLVAQPDGTMPQVNDSFPMPVTSFLSTLNLVIGENEDLSEPNSHFFPDTQVAVLRSGVQPGTPWYLLVNPALTIGAHAHSGRLALNLWYNYHPYLIDSGCCNYDDPLLAKWYRTSRAHNTVLIDERSDESKSDNMLWLPKRVTGNRIVSWETGPDFTFCKMISPSSEVENSSVTWTRNIALVKDCFTIVYDCFESTAMHRYELLFHIAPSSVDIDDKKKSFLIKSNENIALIPADPPIINNLSVTEGFVSVQGVSVKAPICSFIIKDTGTVHSVILITPVTGKKRRVKILKKISEKGVGLKVEDEKGKIVHLLFKVESAPSVSFWGKKTSKNFDIL
jgi:hypothetical protein